MTTQRHGNIDKEWSMTKNVMSEKMENIFFFKLISLSFFIRLIGFGSFEFCFSMRFLNLVH